MQLSEINKVKSIISEGYSDEGIFINDLWMDIYNSNLNFSLYQTFEALVIVLRFMIKSDIAKLVGYDEEQKKEISWEGNGDDELKNLETYLIQFSDQKIKENPSFLFQFKFLTIKWKVPYPLDLKKYGLE